MTRHLRHTDEIASGLLVLLAAGIFAVTREFPAGPGQTTPAFFPRLIAALIAAFALAQFGRALYDDRTDGHEITRAETKTVVGALALVVAYVALMPLFGFLIGTVLFLVATMRFSGVERYGRSIPVALALAVVLQYVFGEFLRVPLPENPILPIARLLPSFVGVIS